jgi:hypothetical protein
MSRSARSTQDESRPYTPPTPSRRRSGPESNTSELLLRNQKLIIAAVGSGR